jgi:hypothetical protein
VECCVREGDFSQKTVYHCELCDRWFCERHIEPRLAFIKDFKAINYSSEVRALYYTEMQYRDGHPDFEYSRRKLRQLDIEEKKQNELIKQALDRMNAHYKGKSIPSTFASKLPEESKTVISEENYHPTKHEQTYEKQKTRRSMPIKKIVVVFMAVAILGVFLWYSPTIISMIQEYFSESSYTKLTVMNNSYNRTTIQFGGVDYFFAYFWQPSLGFGHLGMWNSLVESNGYNLTEGAVYRDFGIEMKVKEIRPEYTVLLVKPTVQNYLVGSGFTKLTIAEGQIQNISFSGNDYIISYSQGHIYVNAPLFKFRDYPLTIVPTIIHCDLGLEIRVFNITKEYVTIFVKSTY